MNTHGSDHDKMGWVELLSQIEFSLQQDLLTVHRLDKGTSGALLFARHREAATELSRLFETHQVKKRYVFLTDRRLDHLKITHRSHIEKKFNQFVSHNNKEPNAETTFEWMRPLGKYFLWSANPKTGKPHQIRLHAQDLGIPVLGDIDHGGSLFVRLCLHSFSLEFPWKGQIQHFQSPLPFWAREEFKSLPLAEWLATIEKRTSTYRFDENDCLRLSHLENPKFRVDQLGPVWWVYWYAAEDPNHEDLTFWQNLGLKYKKQILLRKMLNRGQNPNAQLTWKFGEIPEQWLAQENEVQYEMRRDQGLSPGLFLDQRENRYWLRQCSQDKTVLNLFSYTGAFSVNSALGGAQQVVTVDLSKNFLDWSRKNFELNQLNPDSSKYEFWTMNSFSFLKLAAKKNRKFDYIVCDPPSFSRSKEGIFRIEKDYIELIEMILPCLAPNGYLLFSNNYEGWSQNEFERRIQSLPGVKKILPTPTAGLDYEEANEPHLLKSLLIQSS